MKIAYCLPQIDHPGGIERIESIKANYLVRHYGYDVYIIVAQKKGSPYYKLDHRIHLINLDVDFESTIRLSLLKRIKAKLALKKLYQQRLTDTLNEIKPDITVSTFNQEAGILPKLKDGSKKIIELHFCRRYRTIKAKCFHDPFVVRLIYAVLDWLDERTLFNKYDEFVVLTEEDAADWKKIIPRVKYIPNMITLDDCGISSLSNKEAIAVGRLDDQKGFDSLIDIWRIINQKLPDWHLNIYGDGQDRVKLQNQIDSLGLTDFVTLCGSCPNIESKYLVSSILLMTSNFEGWGLVLTEAMQCGLPCVAYACKCGPKDIISDGIDGYCIEHGNKQEFAQKALSLLQNHDIRGDFGRAAKKNVKRYNQDSVMTLWNNLFNEICKHEK